MIEYRYLNRIVISLTMASVLLVSPIAIETAMAQQCEESLQGRRFSLVVPYGPGGGFDAYARVFATSFSTHTDSTVRIRHLPAAGGIQGINAVVEAGPTDLVLGLFNLNVLLNDRILGRDVADIDSLELLGSLFVDTTVWVARDDYQVNYESLRPRIFALASNSDFIRILLPGFALGWNIELVRGYSGTTELLFALLRGDIDVVYGSASTMANQLESLEGLNAFFSLTDGVNTIFPQADYLTGQGGILEQLTAELTEEQQLERREVARLSMELAKNHRAISISGNADQQLVSCLLTAVQQTLFSEQLANLAKAQNLLIEPLSGGDLQSEIERTEALVEENWDLLQELVVRFRD
jgi:tripartite-type tricarboxylate transporter receptor subunit TctC